MSDGEGKAGPVTGGACGLVGKSQVAAATGRLPAEALVPSRPLDLDRLAHELRTPLAAIQSLADALAEGHLGPVDNPRHQSYLVSIRETARHAIAVVEAMLAEAPEERQALEAATVVDLVATIDEVSASLARLAERGGVRLKRGHGASGLGARARATDVRQMLINLVSNAITHAGPGTTVTLTASGGGGGPACIEVADDGPGIEASLLERLELGMPIDDGPRTGSTTRARLGLAVTRSLVEANGGRLEISSGVHGMQARLLLPADDLASGATGRTDRD